MAAVFLSYSSQDRERVALLAESLRAEGFEVWWDREIPVAVTYEDYIRRQLDSAGAVVVVWSQASVASRYVRWEAQRAERQRGVLVPVMIEEADLPPEYFLVQSADLSRWTGDRSDREWRRLVAALIRLVGEPVRPEAVEDRPAAGPAPAEVPAEVIPASEATVPEALPVMEEAAPPGAMATQPSSVELEPVPEEAIPIIGAAEALAVDAATEVGSTSTAEEVESAGAALAETQVEESLRAWEPAAERAPRVPESAGWEEPRAAGVEPSSAPPWYQRWWVLGLAGALLVAAVVVPVVLVLSGGEEEAASTLAVSTTEAVSTTDVTVAPTSTVVPTTAAIPDVPDMEWARLPSELIDPLMPPAGWGVEYGAGRVAVGSDGSGGDEDAAVYLSPDGVTWERVPHDEAVFGGAGDQRMWSVTAWSGGLVAVGQDRYRGAVWTSTDGLAWERVPDDAGVLGGGGIWRGVRGVTAGGRGLVAVGWDESLDGAAAVWTSADGLTWERVPHDEAVFGGSGLQPMQAVTVGGPGLVAVGQDGHSGAVWASADGLVWERIPLDETVLGGPGAQEMTAVVAAGPGLVAVGWDDSGGDRDGAVWASVDGFTWERVADDERLFGGDGDQAMLGLAEVEGLGLVAWGEDFASPEGKGIWVSPPVPGLEWARVAEGPVDVCFGCAVVEDLEVRVACSWLEETVHAEVWTRVMGSAQWQRVPEDDAVFDNACLVGVVAGGPGLVAVGFERSGGDDDTAVWTSVDGLTWERVPHDEAVFGSAAGQQITGVVAGGPGLVAVGYDDFEGEGDGAVWISVDGVTWERVADHEAVLGGAGFQQIVGIVAGGPGLVAVGLQGDSSGLDATVWTSVDGLAWERVPHDEAVFGGPNGCPWAEMRSVVAGGPGLVAVGNCYQYREGLSQGELESSRDALVWWSIDGIHWHRLRHDDAIFGGPGKQEIDRVVVSEGGTLVGYGWGDDTSPAWWVSPPPE